MAVQPLVFSYDQSGMQPIGLVPLVQDAFALKPELRGGSLVISVSGNGDMSAVEGLSLYLRQIHTVITDLSMTQVEFDFRDLYFLNSSCLKSFVTWIRSMVEGKSTSINIRFITNPKLYWQRRSLEALQRLAPGVVRVES
ncbi:MAG TPA: hypothetical protein VGI10_20195 [Polyangiaceae bacterium]|jgi:hypothetical protein